MTKITSATLVLTASMFLASAMPGLAQSSSSSSMMTAMPKCASGDSIVGVNMTTKMYMTADQMKAESTGMTAAQKQAIMTKNHVKMECKSQAVKICAKPTPPM